MSVSWVTVDKFTELTGIHRDYALRRCRSGSGKKTSLGVSCLTKFI